MLNAGSNSPMRIPMTLQTTNNSTKVKPERTWRRQWGVNHVRINCLHVLQGKRMSEATTSAVMQCLHKSLTTKKRPEMGRNQFVQGSCQKLPPRAAARIAATKDSTLSNEKSFGQLAEFVTMENSILPRETFVVRLGM
jgi:hypothetical protein